MTRNTGIKKKLNRVDYQVSLLVLIIVTLSFLCVYLVSYEITYHDMLNTLRERSDNIYQYVEEKFDKSSYLEINVPEDIDKEVYLKDRELLEEIKATTGVKYLYTAKLNELGDYVYVIDGLSTDNTDFNYPGDLVEEEIIPSIEMAYDNIIVYPDDILDTSWGKIFVSYYPIHQDNEVIGVIGIEFDATSHYSTFSKLRIVTPLIGAWFAIFTILIAILVFRRISNPFYKDFANTDYLTGIRNRNAFELFIKNTDIKNAYEQYGFISLDLNDLKKINDEQGHSFGDEYIKRSCNVLKPFETVRCHLYRIGGDEFVFVIAQTSLEEVKEILAKIVVAIDEYNQTHEDQLSIASGCAFYQEKADKSMNDILNRADKDMYNCKRKMKKAN